MLKKNVKAAAEAQKRYEKYRKEIERIKSMEVSSVCVQLRGISYGGCITEATKNAIKALVLADCEQKTLEADAEVERLINATD